MPTISDDFDARLLGETVSNKNSIFDVTISSDSTVTPYAARYLNYGLNQSRAIRQSAIYNNFDTVCSTKLDVEINDTTQIIARSWFRLVHDPQNVGPGSESARMSFFAGGGGITMVATDAGIRITPYINGVALASYLANHSLGYCRVEIVSSNNLCNIEVQRQSGSTILSATQPSASSTYVDGSRIELWVKPGSYAKVDMDEFFLYHDGAFVSPQGTELRWHTDNNYEYGVDRGVLYLPDGKGVAWSGITSVDLDPGQGESTPLYLDGVKYLDQQNEKDLSAGLTAYTYPDEFLQFDGVAELESGILVDGQTVKDRFSLSYRTRTAHGYRIHILYDLMAVPSDRVYNTLSEQPDATAFAWDLQGIPQELAGFKPTEYFVFDSNQMNLELLGILEGILYGSDDNEAYLPSISVLAAFALRWDPHLINEESNGIHTITAAEKGDITPSDVDGYWVRTPSSSLKPTPNSGIYTLE
jgi:hypothetical protein